MNFQQALDALKDGKYIARENWNGKGMYVFLIGEKYDSGFGHWTYTNGKNDNFILRPFIAMKTVDSEVVPWVASQTDILAEDWGVVK